MQDEVEVLLEMYKVQVARSEHYEHQRAAVTGVAITLSAALVALITFDQVLSRTDAWGGLLIVLLGIFGFFGHGSKRGESRLTHWDGMGLAEAWR